MNILTSAQNRSAFFEELENLKQSFSFENKEDEQKFYKKNSYLFATTSASLFRLLPHISYSKHKPIFEKLLFNLQLLNLEEKYSEEFIHNFEIIDAEESLNKAQKGLPFLFCCFHTGAYSLIPVLLTNKSLDFGFLSNNTLTERKGKHFAELHQKYCEKHNIDSTIQLINVEEKKGIWQAIRLLKEGKSLIVYADGNTGVDYSISKNSKKENQNTVQVNFLGENLQVRQGIAFLSYICNVPIVPIVSNREFLDKETKEKFSLKRKYTFLPAFYPPNFTANFEVKNPVNPTKDTISKEKFASEIMQKLYSILEKEIIRNESDTNQISQWEGWIFVNKFFEELHKPITPTGKPISLAQKTENLKYIFNEERFAVIETQKENQENQKKTLFDKFTYRFFPVSDLLYEIITYFSVPKNLYLPNQENKQINETTESNNPSLLSTNSKLQLSKTLISISALEKLIEKNILVHY